MIIKAGDHFNMAAEVALNDGDPERKSYSGLFKDTPKARDEMGELVITALQAFSERCKEMDDAPH